jgi:hypothetical protein
MKRYRYHFIIKINQNIYVTRSQLSYFWVPRYLFQPNISNKIVYRDRTGTLQLPVPDYKIPVILIFRAQVFFMIIIL